MSQELKDACSDGAEVVTEFKELNKNEFRPGDNYSNQGFLSPVEQTFGFGKVCRQLGAGLRGVASSNSWCNEVTLAIHDVILRMNLRF
eukprot:jgi/Botrbrau1/15853/Bobra.40_1s0037.1